MVSGLGLPTPVAREVLPRAQANSAAPGGTRGARLRLNYCPYHGYADLPFTGTILAGGSGRFRTGIQKNRIVLVCPDGHVWPWLMVWRVLGGGTRDNHGNGQQVYFTRKYGDVTVNWARTQVRRLHDWGFTGIQGYSDQYVHPLKPGLPIQFPTVAAYRPNLYGSYNLNGYAPDAFKNLYQTNPAHHDARGSHFPDPFDPNYQLYLRGMLRAQARWTVGVPWNIGMNVDDTDQLRGFGAGPDFSARGRNNPHLGWITAISKPWVPRGYDFTVADNYGRGNRGYANPIHFAKDALQGFLMEKYGTVAALNSAWHSNYTTFEEQDPVSHSSWGSGSGFMDEDGRHSWMGSGRKTDYGDLSGLNPSIKADLDEFFYLLCVRYFSICKEEVKRLDPNMLYLGPMDLGTWNAPPNAAVLRAAGQYCEVVHGAYMAAGQPDLQARMNFMMSNLGASVPLASWVGFPANSDSALYMYPDGNTQAKRGAMYQAVLEALLWAEAGGRLANVGLSWWGMYDQFDERTNWGLCSYKDNAYDGVEATTRSMVDPYGNRTIPEDRDFGDFITSVRAANVNVFRIYQAQLSGHGRPSSGSGIPSSSGSGIPSSQRRRQ